MAIPWSRMVYLRAGRLNPRRCTNPLDRWTLISAFVIHRQHFNPGTDPAPAKTGRPHALVKPGRKRKKVKSSKV